MLSGLRTLPPAPTPGVGACGASPHLIIHIYAYNNNNNCCSRYSSSTSLLLLLFVNICLVFTTLNRGAT